MDPVTQGVLGAAFTQTVPDKKNLAKAALVGALGGMAPDLDVLIRSSSDPLLALEYHRHFTHSFAFIPFGSLLVALFLYPFIAKRWALSFKQLYLWAMMGYATHALLDVCTSYGTQVFWPFSNIRFSIDTVSVIDPLFTLPLLIAVIICAWRRSKIAIGIGLTWAVLYLSFGAFQHSRAIDAGYALAAERGHKVQRLHAKPSFANLIVWKTIYESDDRYYVDAVRLWMANPMVWEGESTAKLQIKRDFPWLNPQSQQAKDIERFRWFSDDFLAVDENDKNKIVDMRYSLVPNEIKALWGITLDQGAAMDEHVKYKVRHRDTGESSTILMEMLMGQPNH